MEAAPIPDWVLARPLPPYFVSEGGCWLLSVKPSKKGYVSLGRRRARGTPAAHVLAHRLFFTKLAGPIPEGLTLDHLCRNRACVRPKWAGDPEGHTEPVSRGENVLRGQTITAHNRRKTSCLNGHPFDGANTYITVNRGGRQCRQCVRDRMRAFRARRRQAC